MPPKIQNQVIPLPWVLFNALSPKERCWLLIKLAITTIMLLNAVIAVGSHYLGRPIYPSLTFAWFIGATLAVTALGTWTAATLDALTSYNRSQAD